jgi:hypothetical protein
MRQRVALVLLLACPALLLAIPVPETVPAPPEPAKFHEAIGEVLHGARPLESVCIHAGWMGPKMNGDVEVFGDGFAVLDHQKQVTLSRERVMRSLELLHKAGFNGGGQDQSEPPVVPDQHRASVEVTIQGVSVKRTVVFTDRAKEPVAGLAGDLLDLARTHGEQPRVPASVTDGLEQISNGLLDSRTLTVFVFWGNLRDELVEVCVRRNEVSYVSKPIKGPVGPTKKLRLTDSEVRSLLETLRKNRIEKIPDSSGTRSGAYTFLWVSVLEQHRRMRIEPDSGDAKSGLPAKPPEFDNILAHLDILARRTLQEGK